MVGGSPCAPYLYQQLCEFWCLTRTNKSTKYLTTLTWSNNTEVHLRVHSPHIYDVYVKIIYILCNYIHYANMYRYLTCCVHVYAYKIHSSCIKCVHVPGMHMWWRPLQNGQNHTVWAFSTNKIIQKIMSSNIHKSIK